MILHMNQVKKLSSQSIQPTSHVKSNKNQTELNFSWLKTSNK